MDWMLSSTADGRWAEWIAFVRGVRPEDVRFWMERYAALGPLPGMLLTFVEALLPFLPLVVFVVANASAYGLWPGFLYSWAGACLGALFVFLLARAFAGRFRDRIRSRFPKSERFLAWADRQGFTPIFLLTCFPFTPSALINVAAGLSGIPLRTFISAIVLGKAVMIFTLAFLGQDVAALLREPWRLAAAAAALIVLWACGKKLEARYNR